MTAPRPIARGLPPAFWWLWSGIVVNRTTGFIVPYLSIWLTRDHGFSAAAAGAIASAYGAGAIAGSLSGGVVADRVGRRFALLLGLCGSTAAVFALAFAPLALLPALVLAAGFFGESYRAPSLAAVADLVPAEDRERAFGLVYWGVNLGFAAGGAAAGLLASISTQLLFCADAATTLAFAGIVALRVPETRPIDQPAGHPLAETLRGLVATFRDRHLSAFLGFTFVAFLVFMQLNVALPLDVASKGFGPSTLGAIFTVNGVLITLLQPFAARALAAVDRGRLIAGAIAVVGLGFLLHGPAATAPAFAVAVAIWTLGEIAWLPPSSTLVADLSPLALRGRYQGAYSTCVSLAAFVAPLVGPALHARVGSVAFWAGCCAVAFVAAGGQLAIAGPRRRHLAIQDPLPRARIEG